MSVRNACQLQDFARCSYLTDQHHKVEVGPTAAQLRIACFVLSLLKVGVHQLRRVESRVLAARLRLLTVPFVWKMGCEMYCLVCGGPDSVYSEDLEDRCPDFDCDPNHLEWLCRSGQQLVDRQCCVHVLAQRCSRYVCPSALLT